MMEVRTVADAEATRAVSGPGDASSEPLRRGRIPDWRSSPFLISAIVCVSLAALSAALTAVALARLDGWYAREFAWARRPLVEAGLQSQ